jgi:DNA repair exonuclease SbcCD nuclease subunit
MKNNIICEKSYLFAVRIVKLSKYLRDNKDLQFIVFSGNHDLSSRGENPVSALEALDSESNVLFIREPTKIDNGKIFVVPYSTTMTDIIKNNSCKYLFSHLGLSEAQLNSGISIVSKLSLSDLKGKYRYVELGHYHAGQTIETKEISVTYPGDIIQKDWGEKNEVKRFRVIDTDNDTFLSIPTTGYKQHIELEINEKNKDEVVKQAEIYKSNGHEIKLIKSEIFDTDDIKDLRIVEKIDKDITNRGIDSSMSMDEKILKYLQIKEISNDKIDRYKKVGMEIISSIGG